MNTTKGNFGQSQRSIDELRGILRKHPPNKKRGLSRVFL